MEKELNINVTGETKELVIRSGDAAKIFNPEPIALDLKGTLEAPVAYAKVNEANIQKDKAVIKYSVAKSTITLEVDPSYKYAAKVTGRLIDNPELAELSINGSKQFELHELRGKLKFLGGLFPSREAHAAKMAALEKIRVRVEKEFNNENDNKGNQSGSVNIKTQIENGLTEDFYLVAPIFLGAEPMKFKVEICLDASGGRVTCWLESVEMKEIREASLKDLLKEQTDWFEDKGYVVINEG
jgi:hypothetical protein